jgi:hypothetical protein
MSSSLASPPGLPMPEIIADPPVAPLLSRCYRCYRRCFARCYPLFRPLLFRCFRDEKFSNFNLLTLIAFFRARIRL